MEHLRYVVSVTVSFLALTSIGNAQDSGARQQLPDEWRKHHDVRVSLGRCDGIMWVREFREILSDVSGSGDDDVAGISFWSYENNAPPLNLDGLSMFPELKCLTVFDGQRLSDSAWIDIAKRKQLVALIVPTAKLDDDELRTLQSLEDLQILDVSMTEVTDSSIETLASFKHLRLLNISGTRMTFFGGETLRGMLPRCDVVFERWIYGERGGSNWVDQVRKRLEIQENATRGPDGTLKKNPEPLDPDGG